MARIKVFLAGSMANLGAAEKQLSDSGK